MSFFRMPDDMQKWFAPAFADGGPLKTEFDKYYLCLLVGLQSKRRATVDPKTKGFIDYWITDYAGIRDQVLGLILKAELDAKAIAIHERDSVQKACQRLFTHEDPTQLTPAGLDVANAIAYGGFKCLEESWVGSEAPRTQVELSNLVAGALQSTAIADA